MVTQRQKLAPSRSASPSRAAVAIFVIGVVFQLALQKQAQPFAIDGYRFQAWSSEHLMQTVSLEDLREAPVASLMNIHIQPPGLDLVRALLVAVRPSSDIQDAVKQVDLSLYWLWAMAYGLVGAIAFLWLAPLTTPLFAALASLLLLLHPAVIFYATLLDTTLLSAVLILWMCYSLWKVGNDHPSIWPLIISVVLLFFFRAIFQLPSILVLAASLYLLGVDLRRIGLFLLIAGGLCGLYVAKQYSQFEIASTSSFTGINLVRGAGIRKDEYPYPIDLSGRLRDGLPSVLTRKTKLDGSPNFNNLHYLDFNRRLTGDFAAYLQTLPGRDLMASYFQNLRYYWEPSSGYSDHRIVDRLPWRSVYDRVFSAPLLPALLAAAMVIWGAQSIRSGRLAYACALLLPVVYVFLVSVLFEKGENARFKFFLEPVYFVFLSSQAHAAFTSMTASMRRA